MTSRASTIARYSAHLDRRRQPANMRWMRAKAGQLTRRKEAVVLRAVAPLFPALVLSIAGSFAPGADPIIANDNRRPAGVLESGVLTVNLESRVAAWYPNGDAGPSADMFAFAEVGKPAQVPGPLLRAP